MIDGERIDVLARLVAGGWPRRRLLGGLAAGLAAPLLGRFGGRAAAACKKVGRPCDRNGDCCARARCAGGECACKAGFDACAGHCYDLDADEGRCGGCATACAAGEACCGGVCVALDDDPDHCGGCGTRCAEICTVDLDGTRRCRGPRCCSEGKCVDDLNSNPDHCGACNNACPNGQMCCGGTCIYTTFDEANCGACGRACGTGRTCCSGSCVDLEQSETDCGTCGEACPGGETCCDGRCVNLDKGVEGDAGVIEHCGACGASFCNGTDNRVPELCCGCRCVDVDRDETNCGDCDVRCLGPLTGGECCRGRCCPPGWPCCNGLECCEPGLECFSGGCFEPGFP